MAAKDLSKADRAELCNAAQAAWNKLGPKGSSAPFTWRGERYVAKHTSFRLLVDTHDGKPVVSRYD